MSTEEQWISVTDKLPTNGDEVIITFINSVGTHSGQSTFKKNAFYYVAETPSGYFEEVFPIVTHWMPFPKPKI